MTGKEQQNHISQKSKSYEDQEFIHVFYWCIPLDHEIYTKCKKTSNLIEDISSRNICSGIKSQQVNKTIQCQELFDFY